jgi:DNA-binding response OmpR family regulator
MSKDKSILVVDDEKNIRMTMVEALESKGFRVEVAATGEEAIRMLGESAYDLVFLDLKLPQMDGLEVLRRTRETWPNVRVVVITAHGTVDNAVEAMKLGAADFIQKPFNPQEVRELAASVLQPAPAGPGSATYQQCLVEARRSIRDRQFAASMAHIRKAIGLDPVRPEAFNLLGAAVHLTGGRYQAQDYFRAAIALDPTYRPAQQNLERSVGGGGRGERMDLVLAAEGEEDE